MKWFRVALEGATTDGRKISREWLEQMAANYNPAKYGARIWMEHLRGVFPDGPFKAYGDVVATKLEEVEVDGEKRMALYAQLDPTDDLVQMNKQRQKVFSSIEVDPDFAGSGQAYLMGVAVTDSPASLGTEMLRFSASQGENSPLASRKTNPNCLFSEAMEIDLDGLDTQEQEPPAGPSLLDQVKGLFSRHSKAKSQEFAAFRDDLQQTLQVIVEKHNALEDRVAGLSTPDTASATDLDALRTEFNALRDQLDNTPDTPPRAPAAGHNQSQTDC